MERLTVNDIIIRSFVERFVGKLAGQRTTEVLAVDVGCGNGPYRDVLSELVWYYVGVDVVGEGSVTVIGDGQALPLRKGCCDLVVATEVVEHLRDPVRFIGECSRILRQDGVLLLTWPFAHPLHEVPRDFNRMTEFWLEAICEEAGLEISELYRRGNLVLVMWANVSWLARSFLSWWWERLNHAVLRSTLVMGERVLNWFDALMIKVTGSYCLKATAPGRGLSGIGGHLAALPLGYCAVLKISHEEVSKL